MWQVDRASNARSRLEGVRARGAPFLRVRVVASVHEQVFLLNLRMVEELLSARRIDLSYETVRRWSVSFGLGIARRIRSTALTHGDN
jgi:transposase-like protein